MDDANDEVPVFTQQQYNRLGLKETAGIGTSVIVVRATDPDTGEYTCWLSISLILWYWLHAQDLKEKGVINCGFSLLLCFASAGMSNFLNTSEMKSKEESENIFC